MTIANNWSRVPCGLVMSSRCRKTVRDRGFISVVFLALPACLPCHFVRYGGLRGAVYRAAVATTLGDIPLARRGGTTTALRIRLLQHGRIGLGQSSRALPAAPISGIPVSSVEAHHLIALLRQARA